MSNTPGHTAELVKRYQLTVYAVFFLISYWIVGFDGITFSDDVYYLLAGNDFWNGTMVFSDYHFSTRWGAYIPAGLVGLLFGKDPHTVSLISLISYLATYLLLIRMTKGTRALTVLSLWCCTQIYFLHFLTKVYPDSLLVFWVCLVPVAAIYRHQRPMLSGITLVISLFVGFLTKETIVFLAPFPLLLFYFDYQSKELNWKFYATVLATGVLIGIAYLSYFWIAFGDPFFRINSLQAGHYISPYTYADKGFWSVLERLTLLPFETFVQRAYWPWIVFALPGMAFGWKNRKTPAFSFTLAFASLLLCFWAMSTNLKFYNPIYLNPRHLIILVPLLAYLVASGWETWFQNKKWQLFIGLLLIFGMGVALLLSDWKMAAFHAVLLLPVVLKNQRIRMTILGVILIAPAMYSIFYQQNLKQYANLIETLSQESQAIDSEQAIYTHSFIDFSKKLLIPNDSVAQELIVPLYQFPTDSTDFPPRLKVLIYEYYQHAYPEEQVDIDAINPWLAKNYELIEVRKSGNVSVYEYALKE